MTISFSIPVSKCCDEVRVVGQGDVLNAYPKIFTTYKIETNLLNGRVHYTSQDGKLALAFNAAHKQWYIQDADIR